MSKGTAPANGPRCAHHANLPAAVQCSKCGDFLCRLCVRIERNIDTCVTCHAPCRALSTAADDSYYAAVEFTHAPKPKAAARARVPEPEIEAEAQLPPELQSHAQSSSPSGLKDIDPVANRPRPLIGARLPPFFCRNHPDVKATRNCRPCNLEFCDACAKMIEGNPRCTECGGPINALLPEDQGLPPRTVLSYLADALAFPFRGSGLIMIVFGSALVFVCNFGGWKALILSYAFMYTFGIKVCSTSATGRETPPDWPGAGDIANAFNYFVAWLASQLPAIAYLLLFSGVSLNAFLTGTPDGVSLTDQAQAFMAEAKPPPANESVQQQQEREERTKQLADAQERKEAAALQRMMRRLIPFYALSFLGNLYLPMAVLAVILFRNYSVLNPLFIFSSAMKAGAGYIGTVAVFIAADIFRTLPGFLGEALKESGAGFIAVPLLSSILFMYLLMASMRALGAMYYFNQRRLNWFA